MSKIYAVTGGAGFIGSHIAERLLRDGHTVRVVDNFSTGKHANLAHLRDHAQFMLYETSIADLGALKSAFAGAEVVFHQAALPSVPLSVENPRRVHEDCVTGTLNVLIAARDAGARRVVYASSSAVYGDNGVEVQHEDAPLLPISPYGAAKLAGEHYCRAFTASYGLETVCLRYFNVFGPRQDPHADYAAVIPIFMRKMLAGQAPTIYGDGLQTRDFIDVENVVYGNLLAASAPDAVGGVFNLATGERTTLRDLVQMINTALGTAITPLYADERPGDIKHSCADITRAREVLDYTPPISLLDGLARTLAWYREQM